MRTGTDFQLLGQPRKGKVNGATLGLQGSAGAQASRPRPLLQGSGLVKVRGPVSSNSGARAQVHERSLRFTDRCASARQGSVKSGRPGTLGPHTNLGASRGFCVLPSRGSPPLPKLVDSGARAEESRAEQGSCSDRLVQTVLEHRFPRTGASRPRPRAFCLRGIRESRDQGDSGAQVPATSPSKSVPQSSHVATRGPPIKTRPSNSLPPFGGCGQPLQLHGLQTGSPRVKSAQLRVCGVAACCNLGPELPGRRAAPARRAPIVSRLLLSPTCRCRPGPCRHEARGSFRISATGLGCTAGQGFGPRAGGGGSCPGTNDSSSRTRSPL